jgi:hypothetical protein
MAILPLFRSFPQSLASQKRLSAAVAAYAVFFVTAGYWAVPRFATRYIAPRDQPDQDLVSTGFPIKYAGPAIEVVPGIEIRTPRTIHVSQTKPIYIMIFGDPVGHDSDMFPGLNGGEVSDQLPTVDSSHMAPSYTVSLSVTGDIGLACNEPKTKNFGVYPANTTPQTWFCAVHPKDPGDYTVIISGLPSVKDAGPRFIVNKIPADNAPQTLPTFERLPDGTVSLMIQVLTEEGLTAIQWAWLKALGAVIGVLGTILAFPFLKLAFNNPSQLAPVPALPPDEKEKRKSKKEKKDNRISHI